MTNIEVKHLFTFNRFPENDLKLLGLVLYAPFGLILLVLRAVLALGVVLLGCISDAPVVHKLVSKVASLALGISVTVENPDKRENVEVYVSNSRSIFDNLAVHLATGSVSSGPKMHPALSRGLGIHYFGSQMNLDAFKKNVTTLLTEHKIPVHFSPEGKTTNGKALLKFQTHPFSISTKIQPICIDIERPFLDISLTTFGSTYWVDIFCFMFSPATYYRLKFLPPLEKKSLSNDEFAEIVRQKVAQALKVETPELSANDLDEWEKRELVEQQRRNVQRQRDIGIDQELRRMALQVKEVLPHVPLNVIHQDLNRTKNVDSTITNILEGRVHFIPEPPASARPSTSFGGVSRPKVAPSPSGNDRDLFNTAASTFPKSAHERTKSFQERKEQLIANARKRYMERHNLNINF